MAARPESTLTCPQLTNAKGSALPVKPAKKIYLHIRPGAGRLCPKRRIIGNITISAIAILAVATVIGGTFCTLMLVNKKLEPNIALSKTNRK